MEGHSFEPASLTVQSGDLVEFANDSTEAHSVTAYDDGLPRRADYFATGGAQSEDGARSDIAAGLLQQGEKFELTLEVPGQYRYFCIPHEDDGMTGTIIVE
jgi:plastocyanin